MLEEKYTKIIYEIIIKYGKEAQVIQTVEEMSELTKELIKNINRNKNNEEEIKEEISDVIIMIMQLLIIYNFDFNDIIEIIRHKLNRQKERMENE